MYRRRSVAANAETRCRSQSCRSVCSDSPQHPALGDKLLSFGVAPIWLGTVGESGSRGLNTSEVISIARSMLKLVAQSRRRIRTARRTKRRKRKTKTKTRRTVTSATLSIYQVKPLAGHGLSPPTVNNISDRRLEFGPHRKHPARMQNLPAGIGQRMLLSLGTQGEIQSRS